MELKKQILKTKCTVDNGLLVAKGGAPELGNMAEGNQKLQIPSYKISKSWRCYVQYDDCISKTVLRI